MENKTDLVDIILPNYNKAKYLKETLDSIVSQSFKNFKIYVIDDCSKDSSIDVIKKYSDKRIILKQLKKNKGVSFCRNLGVRQSVSKYICFVDSDDYWHENKLENQIKFMEKFNHDFTYTDYIPFTENQNGKKFKKRVSVPEQFDFKKFVNNSSIAMSTVMLKRSIIKKLRFKKLKICEDYQFKCEILKKYKAYRCNNTLMYYRISKDSLQSNSLRNLYWVWNINKKFNNLSLFNNLISVISISLNSIKKYGFK